MWSKFRIFGENWFGLGFVFLGIFLYFKVFGNFVWLAIWDFFYKSGANFEFLAKTGLVSDLFLKVFLYILRFSEISFGLQFGTKILGFF